MPHIAKGEGGGENNHTPPSLRFASIANLQQPRNVLRFQIPCWQNKKSAQEIGMADD